MIYKEIQRDLFTLDAEYVLAHCISADYALGAGIAKVFADRYGVKAELLRKRKFSQNKPIEWDGNGRCDFALSDRAEDDTGYWLVANLVTKDKCYHKPTYDALRQALEDMKNGLLNLHAPWQKGNHKIGMPLIGCGIDGLKWEKVSAIIKEVFADTDFEILVCRI